jgi:hypothetical protein
MASSEREIQILIKLAKGEHSVSENWEINCISQLTLDYFGFNEED